MVKILQGDCREVLKTLPDASVNCCVTSPPYWGLRDYGCAGQLGLEKTPEEYVANMVAVFREVRRVLRDDGTLWLNLGDSYAGSWGDSGHRPERTGKDGHQRDKSTEWFERNGHPQGPKPPTASVSGLKPKDLVGIPWRVAFALQADGWYLRQDIIWSKPNPMPESVTDRCTKAHEYIFLLSKSAKYYYDAEAIKEPAADSTMNDSRLNRPGYDVLRPERGFPGQPSRGAGLLIPKSYKGSLPGRKDGPGQNRRGKGDRIHGNLPGRDDGGAACNGPEQLTRNKRSVWTVTTQPYKDAHFATFPPKLIIPCILAGCPQGGTVLDPFGGSGTVSEVAEARGRNSILIELNPAYVTMANKRTEQQGLFTRTA